MSGPPNPFLATTALEDFWDPSGPLVFLGPWCTRFSRREIWEPRNATTLPSVWETPSQAQTAYDQAGRIYETSLAELGRALNQLHGVSYSLGFWRILVGPWLRWFTHVLLDRHQTILAATRRFPTFRTIGLADSSFVTPKTTIEFVQLNKDDPYNLQLYTQILALEGHDPPRQAIAFAAIPLENSIPEAGWKPALRRALRQGLSKTSQTTVGPKAVLSRSSYFTFKNEAKVALASRGRFRPIDHFPRFKVDAGPDKELRSRLRLDAGASAFDRIHRTLIPREIPTCFVEGFVVLADQVKRAYPSHPAAILSANAWYFDESFKQWAADAHERGTQLLGVQHGGNYGSWGPHADLEHELRITDTFFSWGWNDTERGHVVPLPAPMLVGRPRLPPALSGDILFVASVQPRYLFQFPITPAQFSSYLDWQRRFVRALGPLQERLRIRLHAEDQGWDLRARWIQQFPEVAFDSWSVPLVQSLARSSLFVCDHLSTTFVESLTADHPTLLFWQPDAWPLRPSAEPFYEGLRKAGILWDHPERAANAVQTVMHDPVAWWDNPARQASRAQFCRRFGLTSPNARREWARELRQIARRSRTAS